MPNRGEIEVSALRSRDSAAGARDAWAIVCFCAAGLTLSIYLAAHFLALRSNTRADRRGLIRMNSPARACRRCVYPTACCGGGGASRAALRRASRSARCSAARS